MANSLTITLTEFKTLGSSETYCGYVAMDDFNTTFSRIADTWAGVTQQFPSLKSLVDQVLGEEVFSDLRVSYTIVDGLIQLDDPVDEFSGLSYISVEGADVLYGSAGSAPVKALNSVQALLAEALKFEVGENDQLDWENLQARSKSYLPIKPA